MWISSAPAHKEEIGPQPFHSGKPLRKQIPEPVFGIIKPLTGFRQFYLRSLEKVKGEWSLVTMAWNMKRMFVLKQA